MRGRQGPKRGFVLLGIIAVCLVAPAGCGSSEDRRLPVEGMVLLGDKVLTKGIVILRPDADKGNQSKHEPRGQIGAEGHYNISTASQLGASPGWYKVGVVSTEPSDSKNPYAVPRSLIPTNYNDPAESGLSLEVVENAIPGTYDIKLTPAADGQR